MYDEGYDGPQQRRTVSSTTVLSSFECGYGRHAQLLSRDELRGTDDILHARISIHDHGKLLDISLSCFLESTSSTTKLMMRMLPVPINTLPSGSPAKGQRNQLACTGRRR